MMDATELEKLTRTLVDIKFMGLEKRLCFSSKMQYALVFQEFRLRGESCIEDWYYKDESSAAQAYKRNKQIRAIYGVDGYEYKPSHTNPGTLLRQPGHGEIVARLYAHGRELLENGEVVTREH